MNPLVSVVVPTYRRTEELKKALSSLCEQDYPNVEIIVVDDNADSVWNANVQQIVESIQEILPSQYAFQLIVNVKNNGAAKSRNIGIHMAKGEYITFLDDDDCYLPSKIRIQATAMQTGSADYSLMDLDMFNEKNHLVEHKAHPYLCFPRTKKELIRFHLLHHMTGTDTMMFQRDYLKHIGGFGSIDVGDEFYLMMKAIEGGGQLLYLPSALVHAAVHYDGSGLSGGIQKLRGEQLLFQFKKRYFPQLALRDIRYIRMRHHAVLAFAHRKMKSFINFLLELCLAVLISPFGCVELLYTRHHPKSGS